MASNSAQIHTIYARHPVIGELCREAEDSYYSFNYNASLACLFVLAEASLKYALEVDDRDRAGFAVVLDSALEKTFITEAEYQHLNFLRKLRNKLFHSDPYAQMFEIDGLLYPLSEADTKQVLYELFSKLTFDIAERAVTAD